MGSHRMPGDAHEGLSVSEQATQFLPATFIPGSGCTCGPHGRSTHFWLSTLGRTPTPRLTAVSNPLRTAFIEEPDSEPCRARAMSSESMNLRVEAGPVYFRWTPLDGDAIARNLRELEVHKIDLVDSNT